MAVSDVLFEAAEDIRGYLKNSPESYEPWKSRLDKVLEEMDAIRIELDTPPKD